VASQVEFWVGHDQRGSRLGVQRSVEVLDIATRTEVADVVVVD
jgi:hypothetical protein